MSVRYNKLLFDLIFWLIAEVILNCAGLDAIANYSEFILAQESLKSLSHKLELTILSENSQLAAPVRPRVELPVPGSKGLASLTQQVDDLPRSEEI